MAIDFLAELYSKRIRVPLSRSVLGYIVAFLTTSTVCKLPSHFILSLKCKSRVEGIESAGFVSLSVVFIGT